MSRLLRLDEPNRGPKKCTGPVAPSSDLPTDRRRSDNHSESHQPRTLRTRCMATLRSHGRSVKEPGERTSRKLRPSVSRGRTAFPTDRFFASPESPPRRNAPSRWRLRPASRLTSAEAGADRRAINLGRSVLGASRTLGGVSSLVKERCEELLAICVFFCTQGSSCVPPHML